VSAGRGMAWEVGGEGKVDQRWINGKGGVSRRVMYASPYASPHRRILYVF